MKKTFQKTLIAAAAGVALMSAVGTASANSLLFPYFTTNTGAQSVLSLSNTGAVSVTESIHYVYNYGPSCVHYDASGVLTGNDILSHSIADPIAGGFGKVISTDTSVPVYFPLSNQSGFLVVSTKTTPTVALRGSMAIVDPSTGLVVSYPGIDNALDTTTIGEGNFAAIVDINFPLTSLPPAVVSTSWYGVVVGDMNADIVGGRNWTAGAAISNQGNVWNNDEVPYSGTVIKNITCAATIVPTDLMTPAQAARVAATGSLLKVSAAGVAPTGTSTGTFTGLVMTKFQTVQPAVGAPFAGKQFLHREQEGL